MGFHESSGFCKRCNAHRLVRKKRASHVFHLLLTLFTAGLWLPIWCLHSIRIGGWRCSQCGAKIRSML